MARLQGAVVATAQCFGAAGRLALAPVADWLRNEEIQAAEAALDPAWRAEVARLRPADGHNAGSRATTDAWQRHRFFEGLARALLAVRRPLLLVLDNVQWCDQETLAFITFCLGLTGDNQLLVAATVREEDGDEDRELAGWILRMRATGLLTEIPLGPLSSAETARLAEAIAGRPVTDAEAGLLHAATGGFPLYVVEAARGISDPGVTSVQTGDLTAVLRMRVEQGTPAAREVASLAAAVGASFTLDLLTEASDLGADTVVEAVDELWRRRIVRELGNGYDFSHDLLRETAYAAISPPRRWLLHRRIAQGLELLHAENPDRVAAQLAEQYERAGRPERAVAYYQRAADVAAGVFAHAEQIRLLEKAVAIIAAQPAGRDRDSRELAMLEAMAAPLNARDGYSSSVLERTLERSIALAESLGHVDSTVAGLASLAAVLFVQGHTSASHRIATRALALAEPQSDMAYHARLILGCAAFGLGMVAQALRYLEESAYLVGTTIELGLGNRPAVHGKAFSAHAHWLLGQDEEALAASGEAIRLARAIDHPYSQVVALSYAAITYQMRGDLPELRSAISELHRLCGRYDFAYYREWAVILDGWSREDSSGAEMIRGGIASLKSQRALARMPYWLSLLADRSARDGRPDVARATLDAALADGSAHDDRWWLPEVNRMRAAYDGEQAAIARLLAASKMAAEHGSAALRRRCESDLSARSVRFLSPEVPSAG